MMKRFMAWLGFVNVYDIPVVPPVPGRSGKTVWGEMVDEFGDPALAFEGAPVGWADAEAYAQEIAEELKAGSR